MKKTYTKKQITEAIAYWEKQLKKMNEDANGDNSFILPKEPTTQKECSELYDLIDDAFGGANTGLYFEYVDGKTAEVQGTQRDVDDWDEYSIPYESLMSENEFYEQLLDMVYNQYQEGQTISYDEMMDICDAMFDQAAEEYSPSNDDDEFKTHTGRMHWGGRYPG